MPASSLTQARTTSRDGRRIAQLFRQARQLGDVRPCELNPILAEDEIEVVESRLSDPGYTACLVRNSMGLGAGILLARGQDEGRRRFSIAHELGHFHIPTHRQRDIQGYCADRDMRARDTDANRVEWEANDFAAELLMPTRLFAADAARLDVSFAAVQHLAGTSMYDVSLTAAAWRLVQTTREQCTLVVSAGGLVEWVARSASFRLPLTERQQRVHPESLAASAFRGEGPEPHPRPVPLSCWVDARFPVRGELLESTHVIPRLGQVLSLLWLVEADDENDEL